MTSTGRLKRSCFCAVVAVIASAAAFLIVGLFENQPNGLSSGTSGLLLDLLGIPLAPGWSLMRGMFEKTNLSSLSQILGPALLVLLISVVADTGLIFVAWELVYRKIVRRSEIGQDITQ